MINNSFRLAVILTGLAAAAPQVAWADSQPSLIRCNPGGATWTVTKVGRASGGKVKIFEVKPEYSMLGNVDTPEFADKKQTKRNWTELKDAGSTFEFKAGKRMDFRDYWIVCFPKDTVVDLKLEFTKGDDLNSIPLTVKGFFHNGKWRKSGSLVPPWPKEQPPEVNMGYPDKAAQNMAPCILENFGEALAPPPKGKTGKGGKTATPANVFLTLN